ncbi:flavoprotein [Streptomyces sp. MP131-18]|uniref:flavoprotein n=1 Tax=Streptomyces sp. MP131-18 TaxID=1857892 RepID=UPI00097BC319|nr:flavoprotein [Streptomyces sp. MP131-18]ONK11053.1 bifunctional phosphopantothenoylcysteine decarboxylase/phosphopantothenate synthase [Streptomyces sp. MP131-18]
MSTRVLYLLASAAPPVQYADRAIRDAQARGWDVCLGLSPTAAEWAADRLSELAELTGHPVRVAHRAPGETSTWPPGDVTLITPATLNTVNAIALGLTPTWVAAHACEAIGKRWPLIVMPCVNSAYATHPQFGRSLNVLREAGVRVLYGAPDGFVPNEPGQGRPEAYPWHLALDAADRSWA